MTITLRPYQAEIINAVKRDWHDGINDVLVTAATGSGKTAVFLALLNDVLVSGKRGLVIAHRKELIDQPLARLHSYFPDWQGRAGIVMAGQNEPEKQLIIATVQTLSTPGRVEAILAHGKIDYLVVDECFPAGTLVDGKPIETIQVGETVTAYRDGELRPAKVSHVFKRKSPDKLVRITAGDFQVVCTPNHPILKQTGFVNAGGITTEDEIYVDLHSLRKGIQSDQEPEGCLESSRKGILLERLFVGVQPESVLRNDGENQPEVRQRTDESEQPDAQPFQPGEDAHEDQETVEERFLRETRREWIDDRATTNARRSPGMGNGTLYPDLFWPIQWLSNELQSGYRQPASQVCNRSGRQKPQLKIKASRRPEENRTPAIARVDRVEVLKRGGDGEFERMCPDGYVYNLEVGPYHTYTANGIVVHNCHHATASTYLSVYEALKAANPNLKHLGVTATPIRADGDGLSKVYKKESAHYGIVELIQAGYLAPVRWLAIQVGISLAGVKSANGDFVKSQLSNVYEVDNCFDLVVESHQKYTGDRQAVAFTVTVDGAYRLAEKFRAAGISAAAADGTTRKDTRAQILQDFATGRTQVLCNVGLYTEGLDVPQASCIHQVRPTRSDGLYTQMVGRALRTYPGKVDALILDYAPIETRNIAMMGDVLGIPLRRESYIKDDAQPGETAGGFTFDGKAKWLSGTPAEIISRQLDYLDMTPWSWYRDGGWMTIGLGKASDEIERTLVISPPHDGEMTLYGLSKRDGGSWQARILATGTFDELSEKADEICARLGNATLAMRQRNWRREPPTDRQISYARRIKGAWKPGMTKGQLAQSITHHLALTALGKYGGSLE